jgi:hypothetical protein
MPLGALTAMTAPPELAKRLLALRRILDGGAAAARLVGRRRHGG